jgi:hypothetical protein
MLSYIYFSQPYRLLHILIYNYLSNIYFYYIHDKITAIWLVKRSAIISLIALSRREREIKTTKSNMAAKFR